MRISALPLWVTLPGSAGIAAMSTFLPDLEPWQRWLGFSVGAALFTWAVIGALWHVWRNRSKGAADFDDLEATPSATPAKREPKGATDYFLEQLEQARRWAWATHMPPIETSYRRVFAESKAIIQELERRIAYVEEVLEKNDPAEIRKWRSKLESQRVTFDALDRDNLAALTDEETAQVRIAVRQLGDLDRAVTMLIAEPRKFKDAHAPGLYRQRAEKAQAMLQELIAIMEKDSGEDAAVREPSPLVFAGFVEANDTPKKGWTAVRVNVRNQTDRNLVGLKARLVRAEPPLDGLNGAIHLPLVLGTKARADVRRATGTKTYERVPWNLAPHEEKQVEVVWLQSKAALEGYITHEAGEAEFLFRGTQELYIEITGVGQPIVAGVRIELPDHSNAPWTLSLIIEAAMKAHGKGSVG